MGVELLRRWPHASGSGCSVRFGSGRRPACGFRPAFLSETREFSPLKGGFHLIGRSVIGNNQHSGRVVSGLAMTRSPATARCSLATAAFAIGLASSFLLPVAATAIPIKATGIVSASAPAPGGTPAMPSGPRRPGVIPSTSLPRDTGTNSDLSSGPRRPVPSQSQTLSAKKQTVVNLPQSSRSGG